MPVAFLPALLVPLDISWHPMDRAASIVTIFHSAIPVLMTELEITLLIALNAVMRLSYLLIKNPASLAIQFPIASSATTMEQILRHALHVT
jgi:hypothetical protein